MIEQGITEKIQQGLATAGLNVLGGFFAGQLGKDLPSVAQPQAWAYRVVWTRSGNSLKGQNSWTEMLMQIDCHATTGAGAIQLAKAIEVVMRTIGPTSLADPDATFVDSVSLEDTTDGFHDASRSYVRSLDYLIQFHRN